MLSGALLLLFVFGRKHLIDYMHRYFQSIKYHSIRLYSPAENRLGRPVREIRRAMEVALRKEFNIPADVNLNDLAPSHYALKPIAKYDLAGLITKMTAFATLIMEMGCAYRFPLQDILGEVDRDNAVKSGRQEVLRLFKLMEQRQTNLTVVPGISDRTQGIPEKFRFLRKLVSIAMALSPRARRIAQTFLIELDTEKVGLDDSDWYFCLRRNTHNYRGWDLPARLAELDRIDEEKKHQYIKFEYKGFPGQQAV